MPFLKLWTAVLLSASTVLAVTSVSDANVQQWYNSRSSDLALAWAPVWYFGQSQNQPPCYPTWATQADGSMTPPAAQCQFPNVGCNCRKPGIAIANKGPDFPIYYSYIKCSDTEIRMQYSLFFEKDGFDSAFVHYGHDYDWERVIIIISKSGDNWAPSRILLSQHSGYQSLNWGDIQNTVNNVESGQSGNGQQNLDHPKVYVEWAKHAMRHTRNTGWNDPLSQITDNAFRSQDWWLFSYSYIDSNPVTPISIQMHGFAPFSGISEPFKVHNEMCGAGS